MFPIQGQERLAGMRNGTKRSGTRQRPAEFCRFTHSVGPLEKTFRCLRSTIEPAGQSPGPGCAEGGKKGTMQAS